MPSFGSSPTWFRFFWGYDAEEVSHILRADLEEKSESFAPEILSKSRGNLEKICGPPPQNPDFEEISSVANRISVPKIEYLAQIWIRFGNEMDQISVPNLFPIWWKFVQHADLHKNESTGEKCSKCGLKCVRESAWFGEDLDQIWNENLIHFCAKSNSNLIDFAQIWINLQAGKFEKEKK